VTRVLWFVGVIAAIVVALLVLEAVRP